MTITELRQRFWAEVATKEMLLEYSPDKTQNDYPCDIRCAWVDFTDYAYKMGWITMKQYCWDATL